MRRHCISAGALCLLLAGTAHGERADRERPVNIESDKLTIDDNRKESVFEGNVTLTQGTMVLKADRVIVRQDGEGFNYGIAYGKPAYFRQKREGFDELIEGYGQRLEYDGKADKLQMFTDAQIRKGGDEVHGDYISYDAVTEFYQVIGGGRPAATTTNPKGRVTVTIQPKRKTAPAAAPAPAPATTGPAAQPPAPGTAPSLPLKPSTRLKSPLEE